jgi:hypothetical protein
MLGLSAGMAILRVLAVPTDILAMAAVKGEEKISLDGGKE